MDQAPAGKRKMLWFGDLAKRGFAHIPTPGEHINVPSSLLTVMSVIYRFSILVSQNWGFVSFHAMELMRYVKKKKKKDNV